MVEQTKSIIKNGRYNSTKIKFYTPGFKNYKTTEHQKQNRNEFVSISVTGMNCALNCEHCKTASLKGMISLPDYKNGSLYDLCAELKNTGAKGILLSGGSDKNGKVPILKYVSDLIRIKSELNLAVSVHPGLTDEETCAELANVNLDGLMLDIIGDDETIKDIYHLEKSIEDYEQVLDRLDKYNLPVIPHILIGHYFGRMSGEYKALEMLKRHNFKMLVLLVIMPLPETSIKTFPSLGEINDFFIESRNTFPDKPIILGCARPIGDVKYEIDKLAIDAGLNGIAFPADGILKYVINKNLDYEFIDSCCGVVQ